jgi:hypothetical protein
MRVRTIGSDRRRNPSYVWVSRLRQRFDIVTDAGIEHWKWLIIKKKVKSD